MEEPAFILKVTLINGCFSTFFKLCKWCEIKKSVLFIKEPIDAIDGDSMHKWTNEASLPFFKSRYVNGEMKQLVPFLKGQIRF